MNDYYVFKYICLSNEGFCSAFESKKGSQEKINQNYYK